MPHRRVLREQETVSFSACPLPVAVAAPLRFEHPETLSFYVCGILDYL
jgi:hypothetical protein